MHNPYANVVNGGLIDFQDTSMLHAQPVHASMIMSSVPVQQGLQGGVYYVGQQQPTFPQVQQQPTFPQQQPAFPQVQQQFPAGYVPPAVQQGQCFTGPPSFVHFNGQTYKPVEETAASAQVETPKLADSADMRGLERKIEERVTEKVNEFMSKQDKHVRSSSVHDRAIETNAFHKELARLNQEMRRRR